MRDSLSTHPAMRRLRQLPAFYRIPFRPVPVKARHDGWTRERQRGFIDRLVLLGCVARAARAVGKTPQSAYRLREHKGAASFRRAWDEALVAGRRHMLDVAADRALNGEIVPIVHLGRCVGERHRFDNRLAMAVLNAMDRRNAGAAIGDAAGVLERFFAALDVADAGDIEK